MLNLTYKAVENSKNSQGESGNNPAGGSGQLTLAQKRNLIDVARKMGATHFQTHLYMDTDTQMRTYYTDYAANYNRLTLEQETQEWSDVIHDAGMRHVHRGTWSGVKGNNNFPFVTYGTSNFVPLGTVANASTEGESTYCGKMWRYLETNVGTAHMEPGDIFMPISECTEFLSNSNYTWFDTSAGVQTGLYNFFLTLHDVVDAWGTLRNKSLGFATIVNYSEYRSGYLNSTLPADTNHIAIDYYGHYSTGVNGTDAEPAAYVVDWTAVRTQVGGAGYPLYQTEMGGIFGDSWPTLGATAASKSRRITTYEESTKYQMDFWKAYRDSLINPGLMNGVSNWGMWSGQNSSIVYYSGGTYYPNYFGQIYANFIKGGGMARIPVPNDNSALVTWGSRSVHF